MLFIRFFCLSNGPLYLWFLWDYLKFALLLRKWLLLMLSLCSLEWFLLFVSYSLVTAILLTLVILSIKLSLFKLLRLRPDCYGPFEPVLQAQGGRPSVTHRIMCGVCAVLLSTYPDRSPWLSRLLWTLLSTSQHPLFFPKVLSFL